MTVAAHWLRHVIPLTLAAALVAVVVFSRVALDLVIVDGTPADVVALAAAGLLVALAVRPGSVRLHMIAGPLVVGVLAARAIGFAELASERGTWDLTGAVLERIALLTVVGSWHLTRIIVIQRDRAYR